MFASPLDRTHPVLCLSVGGRSVWPRKTSVSPGSIPQDCEVKLISSRARVGHLDVRDILHLENLTDTDFQLEILLLSGALSEPAFHSISN